MPTCKRCGACCKLKAPVKKEGERQKVTDKDCRYLIRHANGKTSCRVYNNRKNAKIGKNQRCVDREFHTYNYPGCPYNRPEWEMIEHEND